MKNYQLLSLVKRLNSKPLMQPLRILRISFLLLFFTLSNLSATVYSQSKISMSVKNKSLKEAFTQIENQTEYKFLYRSDLVDLTNLVNVEVNDATLENVLVLLLDGTNINYNLIDKELIVLSPRQDKRISGTVRDSDGNTLPGVTVCLKENGKIVWTDTNGLYTIDAADTVKTIIFTFIGMLKQEVPINNRTVIDVTLQPDMVVLQDVVVTGFQSRNKQQMVGSISTIKSADFETTASTTIEKALTGKIAGVYTRSNSGRPGEVADIQIRGVNTMSGNTQPLYVLDGMPLQPGEITGSVSAITNNGLGNIPPEDIESITILKDATAAAIYGSRAANGVVVITTKNGTIGNNYIMYTGKVGITSAPVNKFQFMNSNEKIEFERGLYTDFRPIYGGRVIQLLNMVDNGVLTAQQAEEEIASFSKNNTDWMDEIYNPALSHSHNVTLSGGNNRTQYYASANYQSSDGTLINNNYQSGGLNLKVSSYIKPNLLVAFYLYSTLKNNKISSSLIDPFKYAAFANTYEKPYNDDGSYSSDKSYLNLTNDLGTSSDLTYKTFNIIRELNENTLTTMYSNARGQIRVEYSFLKGFKFSSTGSYDYTTNHNIDESYPGTYRSFALNWFKNGGNILAKYNMGQLSEDMSRTNSFTIRNSLEYTKLFAEKHFIQAFAANEVTGSRNNKFNHFNPIYYPEYRLVGYPTWADFNTLTSVEMVPAKYNLLNLSKFGGSSLAESRGVSFITSLVYSYDDRYVFNGNWRMDGVDIIGSDNQFSPLWSAGLKWNAHNEKFLKPYNDIISRFVLSLGYGFRGSINRSSYPFNVYTVGVLNYDEMPAAQTITYGNPVLKWERKGEKTIGTEISLFKGRINLEAQLYNENIKDLLDATVLASSLGRTSITMNSGNLVNKGWELSTRIEVVKAKNFLVEVGGNISEIKNNIVKSYYTSTPNTVTNSTRNIQGYPVNSWFGYKFSHINEKNGNAMVWALRKTSETVNGVLVEKLTDELIDLDGMTSSDLTSKYVSYHLGQRDPKIYGGFNTRLVYSNFELTAQFAFATGNVIIDFQDRINGPSGYTDDITSSRTNRLSENVYRWRQSGDITNIPKFRNSVSNYTRYLTDNDLSDGSYLKCSSLALSWRAPGKFLKKTNLNTLRVSLMANNLFTVTNYRGTDPETQTPFGYPNTKIYTLSLSIGF